ncbi:MAG: hypothetical protein IKE01_06020 [Clostridia bacterium]|nr:hypothetical protein [Clostridia bacterium]
MKFYEPKRFFSKHVERAEVQLIPARHLFALQDLFDSYGALLYSYITGDNQQCKKFYLSEVRGFYVPSPSQTGTEKLDVDDYLLYINQNFHTPQLFFGKEKALKPFSSAYETAFLTKPLRHFLNQYGWDIGVTVDTDMTVIYAKNSDSKI